MTEEERKKKAVRWAMEHQKPVYLHYNYVYDKEIIAKLNSVPNKSDYIRKLILADIRKSLGEQ